MNEKTDVITQPVLDQFKEQLSTDMDVKILESMKKHVNNNLTGNPSVKPPDDLDTIIKALEARLEKQSAALRIV